MQHGQTTLPAGSKHCRLESWEPPKAVADCTPVDVALSLAVAYVRLTEPRSGEQPVKPDVACLERFEDYILGFCDGIPKTPEWAAYYTGIPSYTIKALAKHWSRPAGAAFGWGSENDLCGLVAKAESLRMDSLTRPVFGAAALPGGFIGGTVYDYETDEVIEGAEVTISRVTVGEGATAAGGSEAGLKVVTDDFGVFCAGGQDHGEYLVSIEKKGYSPREWGPVEIHDAELVGFPMFME